MAELAWVAGWNASCSPAPNGKRSHLLGVVEKVKKPGPGWLGSWLGWLWLAGWLAGWLEHWLAGVAGWLGWLGWLAGTLVPAQHTKREAIAPAQGGYNK